MKHSLRFLTLFAFLISAYSNAQTVYDLQTEGASYLGGAGNDEGNAVEIQSDNTIVIAGKIEDESKNYNVTPTELDGGGKGVIIRLNATGTEIKSITRIGGNIDDMDINYTNDKIAVVGQWGIALLSADGSQLLWKKSGGDIGKIASAPSYSSGRRIAIGTDGTVAAMFNKSGNSDNEATVYLYDEDGNEIGSNPHIVYYGSYNSRHEDITVDSENKMIIQTGFRQASPSLVTPWVMGYSYNDTDMSENGDKIAQKYISWSFWGSAADETGLQADSKGMRVAMGRDGNLYFTGFVHGGNNIFTRTAADYKTNQTNNVNIDNFTTHSGGQASGFSGAYIARMNPADGSVIKGMFHHNRNNDGKNTTWLAHSIAANENGEVIFGGSGAYAFACRPEIADKYKSDCDNQSLMVNGTQIGPYKGGEGAVVELQSDFSDRNLLAVFTAPSDNASIELDESKISAVAAKGKIRVVLSTTKGKLFTKDAFQDKVTGGWKNETDIYFATWGGGVPTGINSVTDNGISIYPNPASDMINIQLDRFNTETRLSIINSLGKVVLESQINNPEFTINTAQLPNGIYFINLIDQASKKTFKVVVNH